MNGRPFLCFAAIVLASAAGAQVSNASRDSAVRPGSAASSPSDARKTGRGGILPDPALLDGSNQPPEKRPEHGMLGEFEMPGDDNAKSDKVGGSQPEQPAGASANSAQAEDKDKKGGGGAPPDSSAAQNQNGGAAAQADAKSAQGGGAASSGPNDPNAKAEGTQVAELKTDESNGPAGAGQAGGKPQQIALGDSAMQITPTAAAANVIGTQQAGSTQQYEKPIGHGTSGSTNPNSNRGVEKGRTMPEGL